jgi:uncharacterized LabA/DUF88 family protein
MLCTPRHVILLDGAFLIWKLQARLHRFPTASDIQAVATSISNHAFLADQSCLRIYFYHARPAADVLFNPISKKTIALSSTQIHIDHAHLLQELEKAPDFALRLGETDVNGWQVGYSALRQLVRTPRPLKADDLVPAITQKGVDLRIGLDIARLALTHAVETIVVVTADSDLVPAFKFARREGLRVVLCHLGHRIKRELFVHADRIMTIDLATCIPVQQVPEDVAA